MVCVTSPRAVAGHALVAGFAAFLLLAGQAWAGGAENGWPAEALNPETMAGLSAMGGGNTLSADLKNNWVGHAVTGDNIIGDGAFNDAVGLVNVIQNSGNMVVIQNAVTVNVDIHN